MCRVLYIFICTFKIRTKTYSKCRHKPIVSSNLLSMTHQSILKGEDADIAAVVYVVAAHDRVGEVLHPDAGERVARDLVVLVGALRVVRYVKPYVLAVADVAVLDHGVRARAADTHRRANWWNINHIRNE